MIDSGEDPLFIARRLVILASKTSGLRIARVAGRGRGAAGRALHRNARRLLSARASDALSRDRAEEQQRRDGHTARRCGRRARRATIRCRCTCATQPTGLMSELGYGSEYRYAHDDYDADQTFLPDNVSGRTYYVPGEHGAEAARAEDARKKGGPSDLGPPVSRCYFSEHLCVGASHNPMVEWEPLEVPCEQESMTRIYLDNAATTPVRREVADAMDAARRQTAYKIRARCTPKAGAREPGWTTRGDRIAACSRRLAQGDYVHVGSGTESDNLAILGAVRASGRKGARIWRPRSIITPSFTRSTRSPPKATRSNVLAGRRSAGAIEPERVSRRRCGRRRSSRALFYANNEIGTVSPVAEFARIARERGVLFHTDAVQAPGWLPVDVASVGADLISISARKFEGPKGVGALLRSRGVSARADPSTEEAKSSAGVPVRRTCAGIVGMARALRTGRRGPNGARGAGGSPRGTASSPGIAATIPGVRFNGGRRAAAGHGNSNVSFAGALSEELLLQLDLQGVAVSAGSACTSGRHRAESRHRSALGSTPAGARGAIRFTLGRTTTEEEIDRVLVAAPRRGVRERSTAGERVRVARKGRGLRRSRLNAGTDWGVISWTWPSAPGCSSWARGS